MFKCLLVSLLALPYFTASITVEDGFCAKDSDECAHDTPPNVVLLLADDMGYGDLTSYGHPSQEFNDIDRLAVDGLRFTQFYSGDSMCTPARAALLTGRLPIRTGMTGGRRVLLDYDTGGLPRSEWTLAEMFGKAGYTTGMAGKWHLGINKDKRDDGYHLPNEHGFDYVGWNLPFSHLWQCDDSKFFTGKEAEATKCFLYYGRQMKAQPYDTQKLADQLDESWHEFLGQQTKKQPFFYFYSFPHVHAAQWPTRKTATPSRRDRYGDAINEIGWAVGQVRRSLEEAGIANNTLIIFLSDHGPHRELCAYGGSTGGLRGGKSNAFEGGYRIPAIVHWPGRVARGGVSNAVLSSLDLMPSLATLAARTSKGKYKTGKSLYSSVRHYDGIDALDYLLGDRMEEEGENLSKGRPIFYYCNKKLMAVRWSHYKMHYIMAREWTTSLDDDADEGSRWCLPGGKPVMDAYISQTCRDSEVIELDDPIVFDLNLDPFERFPLENGYIADVIKKFDAVLELHVESIDLEDEVPEELGKFNANVIPCCNYPKCSCD